MFAKFYCFVLILSFLKYSYCCAATSSTPAAAAPDCSSCLESATTIVLNAASKAFTSDVIDTSGTCATRTFVCDGNTVDDVVAISYNDDENGTDTADSTLSSTLICNTAGQWTRNDVPITRIECQSS